MQKRKTEKKNPVIAMLFDEKELPLQQFLR